MCCIAVSSIYSETSNKYCCNMHIKINETTPRRIYCRAQVTKSELIGNECVKTEHGMAAWGPFLKSYEWYPYTDDSHTRFPYKDEIRYSWVLIFPCTEMFPCARKTFTWWLPDISYIYHFNTLLQTIIANRLFNAV